MILMLVVELCACACVGVGMGREMCNLNIQPTKVYTFTIYSLEPASFYIYYAYCN